MKIATLSRILLFALMLTSAGGCATHALWSDSDLDALNGPAPDPNLSLYSAKSKKDLLVVYDEISGRNESVHRRAYWLDENRERTENREHPFFVNERLVRGLTSVPVFFSTNAPAAGQQPVPCAVLSTNNANFTLFSGEAAPDSYLLPVYDDGRGQTARVFLTPLSITADAAIVGGFLGYLYLEGMANQPYHYSP